MNDNPDASIEREREIFLAALEKTSPEERKTFLDRACGNDAALRARVESLLRHHSEDGFLEEPAIGAEAMPPLESAVCEGVGTIIGRYKLLQKIGEGGMGVVYMAEQEEPVRRKVALKVIKLGMDTKQVVARFEAERQALALMDHPNIARVLDGGATDTGRPFFVMELVQGVPITEFCDKNQLSVEERVKLFISVCQAIQSAHQKGIIHRDLKPTNILVTLNAGVPHPMVIDFGVAKATNQKLTEKTVFTNYATMIGTPAYMSPEQAEMSHLDVDTRTDIYGLGVLLYELLTGTTPFPEKRLRSVGYNEMQRIIMEEEPERPSTRLRQKSFNASPSSLTDSHYPLSTDLDWIVMKCLEKDRARRYETANGLAKDLQRHLDSEPVIARPPSNFYRFQKLVRRNKLAFAAGTAVAAALLVGLAISTFLFIQERRAHDSATRAEKLAAGRLIESENARKDAEAVSKFLTEVLQSPDPERDARTITVAETLSNAVENLAVDLANQPARRAKLQATLGRTYYALGLYREAIPLQQEVRDYYLAASGPENADTIAAMYDLARSYGQAGRAAEAVKLGEQVLAFRRKMSGPENPDTLWAMNNLAIAYERTGRTAEALTLREHVFRLRRKVLGPEHPDTLVAMNNLALSYDAVDRQDQCLKLREEVLALWQKVGPERPGTLLAMHNLGYSYQKAGRREEALKLREKALALYRKVLGPENPYTLFARRALADSYYSADRLDEALKLREETLALYRKVLGPEHPETLNAMNELAESYGAAGRWGEALKLREEGLALRRKVLGPDHPDTIQSLNDLAWAMATDVPGNGNGTKSLNFAEEAVAATHRTNAGFLDTLAASYAETQQFDKAVAAEREAIGLAKSEQEKKEYESRLKLFQSNIRYQNDGALADQTHAQLNAGKYGEAEASARDCLILREQLMPDSWRTFNARSMLGASLLGQRKYEAAEPLLLAGYEGLSKRAEEIPSEFRKVRLTEALQRLADLYEQTGRQDQAVECKKRLADLDVDKK